MLHNMHSPFKNKTPTISKAGSVSPVKSGRFIGYNNNNNSNHNNDTNTVLSCQSSLSLSSSSSNSMGGTLIDYCYNYPSLFNSFNNNCQIIVPKTDDSAEYKGRNKLQQRLSFSFTLL